MNTNVSVVGRWKREKHASWPHFSSPFLEYDHRSVTFYIDCTTLSTIDGRVTAEYVLPDEDRDTPHTKYLFGNRYDTTDCLNLCSLRVRWRSPA